MAGSVVVGLVYGEWLLLLLLMVSIVAALGLAMRPNRRVPESTD